MTAGNRAMAQLAIQRGQQAAAPVQSAGVALMVANRGALEDARAAALLRMARLSRLESQARDAAADVRDRLVDVSGRYDEAYGRYARVIGAAGKEATNQQEWTDIFVGIAIGVLVGLAFEGIATVAAVDAAAAAMAKGAKAYGRALAQEATAPVGTQLAKKLPGEAVKGVKGETAEAVVGKGVEATGAFEVAGKDLKPDGLRPEILQMRIWQALTQLHTKIPLIGPMATSQGLLMANSEYAIGEIKAHASGGSGADMSEADAIDMVLAVLSSAKGGAELDKAITKAESTMTALSAAARTKSTYTVDQMERDIWVLWMSRLKKGSNILDLDAIEDHLGPDGLGLVDFGWYTSDDDENEAIETAKGRARDVRARLDSAMTVGSVEVSTQ